jgi:hypothetical protein
MPSIAVENSDRTNHRTKPSALGDRLVATVDHVHGDDLPVDRPPPQQDLGHCVVTPDLRHHVSLPSKRRWR